MLGEPMIEAKTVLTNYTFDSLTVLVPQIWRYVERRQNSTIGIATTITRDAVPLHRKVIFLHTFRSLVNSPCYLETALNLVVLLPSVCQATHDFPSLFCIEAGIYVPNFGYGRESFRIMPRISCQWLKKYCTKRMLFLHRLFSIIARSYNL